ncbi:pantoate--beta-alanine ligase [Flavobacteriaceae bacterium]|nr:pantoate--beta-alanine ligase [Flavobacteriaceae bacterium]
MPKVFMTEELRLFQRKNDNNRSWGLVPTMGSLHQGHLKLIQKAHAENAVTFVSIFVNPTQFGSKNDLENYPSTIDADVKKIHAVNPNICVFIPSVETIYPDGTKAKKYALQGLDKPMEGMYRPGHFDGVVTVVERLFTLVQPDVAYFGQKDFQQLQIVSLLAKPLGIEIRSLPTVREANGLAMSSRNSRLSDEGRESAKQIYKTLQMVKSNFSSLTIDALKTMAIQKLSETPQMELEYFEIVAEHNLNVVQSKAKGVSYRAFVGVVVEGTRLIDNISLN